MGRGVLIASALWLLGAGVALAQVAPVSSLPEGTFASEPEGCTKLETKTPAELGEELDFEVLTSKGVVGYQQLCDFVNVLARDGKSWIATAFCEESGYTYPDLFSIKQKDDGTLNVTRITDLTQQGGYEANPLTQSGETESPDQPEDAEEEADESSSDQSAPVEAAPESYASFVKCQNVKQ